MYVIYSASYKFTSLECWTAVVSVVKPKLQFNSVSDNDVYCSLLSLKSDILPLVLLLEKFHRQRIQNQLGVLSL